MDYSDFIVPNAPETILYIPNFITSDEEHHIISSVDAAPKPKWTQLARRRLLNYGGIPHKNGMIAEEIPSWLKTYIDKINNIGIFDPKKANHVLVNEYLPNQGIMGHTDGPLFYPTISTISCGSHTLLEFYKMNESSNVDYSDVITKDFRCDKSSSEMEMKSNRPIIKLLIEPRSLLILKNEMYENYLHQISELDEDVIDDRVANLKNCETLYKIGEKLKRDRRISLTIRHVPKTSKMKLRIGVS